MTVHEVIALLHEFPQELPVFLRLDDRGAVSPRDAIMDLGHPDRGEVLDDDQMTTIPPGFVDAVVLYPRAVREAV